VKAYLKQQDVLVQIILAILDWEEESQDQMWVFCTHGKHRSQSACTIISMLVGAVPIRRRPEHRKWCNHRNLTSAQLCDALEFK